MKPFDKIFHHSPGPWHPGHLGDETTSCNCHHIIDECHMGGIGEVYIDNGIRGISNGQNDCPPKEEAVANMHLMSASPDLLDAAIMAFENMEEIGGNFEDGDNTKAWEYIFATKVALNHAIKKALNQLK